MKETYPKALKLILAHEGGFVNHPKDPGGATNKGVTQGTYNLWRKRKKQPTRSVREITDAEVAAIYRNEYADKVSYDRMPAGLDYAMFDYAVNSGPGRAIKDLQRVLEIGVDGVIGQETMTMVLKADVEATIIALCERRLRFMKSLKTWGTFGKGWQRRVMGRENGLQDDDIGVIDYAVMMARVASVVESTSKSKPDMARAMAAAGATKIDAMVDPIAVGSAGDETSNAKADPGSQSVTRSKIGMAAIAAGGLETARTGKDLVEGMSAPSAVVAICITVLILAALLAVVFLYKDKLREQSIK